MTKIKHPIDLGKHLIKNGPKFCSHRLQLTDDGQVALIKPTLPAMSFCIFYLTMGIALFILAISTYIFGGQGFDFVLFIGGIGAAIAIFGASLIRPFLKPVKFDKNTDDFSNNNERIVELRNIHSLQINNKLIKRSDGLNYLCYELNMLTENGRRINIFNHNDLEQIRKDANLLTEFLGITCTEYLPDLVTNA